jgi:hypothetical protein
MNNEPVHPFNAAQPDVQPLYKDLDEFDVNDLVELMKEPVRAIHTCISKGQLEKLCKQLLAQNLVLQQKLQRMTHK